MSTNGLCFRPNVNNCWFAVKTELLFSLKKQGIFHFVNLLPINNKTKYLPD